MILYAVLFKDGKVKNYIWIIRFSLDLVVLKYCQSFLRVCFDCSVKMNGEVTIFLLLLPDENT